MGTAIKFCALSVLGLMGSTLSMSADAGRWLVVEDFTNGAVGNSQIVTTEGLAPEMSFDAARSQLVIRPSTIGPGASKLIFDAVNGSIARRARGLRVELTVKQCSSGAGSLLSGQMFLEVLNEGIASMLKPRRSKRDIKVFLAVDESLVGSSSDIIVPGDDNDIVEVQSSQYMTKPIRNGARNVFDVRWTANSILYSASRAGTVTHKLARKARKKFTAADARNARIVVTTMALVDPPADCEIRLNRILGYFR